MTSDANAKLPIPTYVMIEAAPQDRVIQEPSMVRFQSTEDGDRHCDHLIYLYPQGDGVIRIMFGPSVRVEFHGRDLVVSTR